MHCPFAAPARRSWLAKIFGRTQPDRTSSEHVALIEQAAQTPRRSSLLAEADVHVTARPIHALTSPTAAEAEHISRVVEPPAAARAAADDDLPPHVVGRAADELFPQPIATQQPPSPQCASHIQLLYTVHERHRAAVAPRAAPPQPLRMRAPARSPVRCPSAACTLRFLRRTVAI